MNFDDGILYIFISILTILIDKSLKPLIDYTENNASFKNRMKKYFITSLLIVLIYLIVYFLSSNTSEFHLTKEDSIILLLIYIFSNIYFNLNASISTLVNQILTRKKSSRSVSIFMVASNIIIPILMISLSGLLLKNQNFINVETKAIIKSNGEEYSVIIPKKTAFNYDFIPPKNNEKIEQNGLLNPINSESEYEIRKDSVVIISEGTYLKYISDKAFLNTNGDNEVSKIKFYLTEKSLAKLNETSELTLLEDTRVSIHQKNSYVNVLSIHIFFLALGLVIYYLIKDQYKSEPIEERSFRVHFKELPSDNVESLGLWSWDDVEVPSSDKADWPTGATSFAQAGRDDYGYYMDVRMKEEQAKKISLLINNTDGENLTGDKTIERISSDMNQAWFDQDFKLSLYKPLQEGFLRRHFFKLCGILKNWFFKN